MLALDPNTGKIKWGYQYTPNDAWDYDGMATPILVDTTIEGKPVKAAVVSNRNGYFYAIDRSNGRSFMRSRSSRISTGQPASIRKPASPRSTRP
jgi:alcohol dehydrogenase (cytochrome c)